MFCKFLSNTYHFSYDNVKPCCWIKRTPETQINILDPNIKEKLATIRQVDNWIPECSYCHDLENAGTTSPRSDANKETIFRKDDIIGDAVKIELQLDDDCNAACLMCGTWNSTTWQQYEEKTIKSKSPSYRWQTTIDERITAVNNTVDFNKTREIHFFGGEPFKGDTQLRILEMIERPENIKLVYITNGSLFPCDKTLELWKQFNKVHIGISIDGIGEHFNYLRWPLQWHQVEANLIKYIELNYNNVTINSSFTASPFNIFYIDQYTAWATEFEKHHKTHKTDLLSWFLKPQPVMGDHMDMSCIPPKLQKVIKNKYGEYSRIAKIMNKFDLEKCLHMLNYTRFHDKRRKNRWQDVFPEIVEHFDMDKIAPVPKKVWEIRNDLS
jgi:sulfatase maturation enzyme AslB (radical SAM superfamily)